MNAPQGNFFQDIDRLVILVVPEDEEMHYRDMLDKTSSRRARYILVSFPNHFYGVAFARTVASSFFRDLFADLYDLPALSRFFMVDDDISGFLKCRSKRDGTRDYSWISVTPDEGLRLLESDFDRAGQHLNLDLEKRILVGIGITPTYHRIKCTFHILTSLLTHS